MVVPNGNTAGALFVIVKIPVISSAVTFPNEMLLLSTLSASTVMFSGTIKVGLFVSMTKIV